MGARPVRSCRSPSESPPAGQGEDVDRLIAVEPRVMGAEIGPVGPSVSTTYPDRGIPSRRVANKSRVSPLWTMTESPRRAAASSPRPTEASTGWRRPRGAGFVVVGVTVLPRSMFSATALPSRWATGEWPAPAGSRLRRRRRPGWQTPLEIRIHRDPRASVAAAALELEAADIRHPPGTVDDHLRVVGPIAPPDAKSVPGRLHCHDGMRSSRPGSVLAAGLRPGRSTRKTRIP